MAVSLRPLIQYCGWAQVLLEESTQRVPAALHGLAVFVDTLRLLVDAQQTVAASGSSPRQSPAQNSPHHADSASPMEEDTQAMSNAQRPEASGVREGGQDAIESPKGAAVVKKMCAHMLKVIPCTRRSTALAFALRIEAVERIHTATLCTSFKARLWLLCCRMQLQN